MPEAGTSKAPAKKRKQTRKPTTRSIAQRKANNAVFYGELLEACRDHGIVHRAGSHPGETLQRLLDRAVAHWEFAASMADQVASGALHEAEADAAIVMAEQDGFWAPYLDAQKNWRVRPNRWHELESSAAAECERLATSMVHLGLAERMVRIEETKALAVVTEIRAAARDAGLNQRQVRALGGLAACAPRGEGSSVIECYESTGRYLSGRRTWFWFRTGRWWAHVEVGRRCLHVGTRHRRDPWQAPWHRRVA